MSKWQAVVFDLDDTLFPECAYVYSGFHAVADWVEEHRGILAADTYRELSALYTSGIRGNTFNRWAGMHGIDDDELVASMVAAYHDHMPQIAPFAQAVTLLHALRGQCCTGLVSDGLLAVQQRKLHALGIGELFDVTIFSDAWGRSAWKPNPWPYHQAMAAMQASPELSVYVGDNPVKDFLGARRAGMNSIRLRLDKGEYTHLEPATLDAAPDSTVTTFAQLQSLLVF